MAFKKKRVNPQTGETETVTVLEIVESSEPAALLKLEDGTLIRAKSSVVEVVRRDEKDANGKDIYDLQGNMTISVTSKEDQEGV